MPVALMTGRRLMVDFFVYQSEHLPAQLLCLQGRLFAGQNLLAYPVDGFTDRFGQDSVRAGQLRQLRQTQQLVHLRDFS